MGLRGPQPQPWEVVIEKIQDNSYLDENTGCYVWMGHYAGEGYGVIQCEGQKWYIHRLIYSRYICEELPEVVMHKCDVRRCWNPEHLVGGTHQDNVDDKMAKGRYIGPYGCKAISTRSANALVEIDSSALA